MVVYRGENAAELRRDWNKLLDDVQESYQCLSPSVVESACKGAKSDCRKLEVLRPTSPVLNLLLDAISLKFAELEKHKDSSETGTLHIASASQSERENPQEGCYDDSTDDEFFGSPSVMSYSRLRILDRPASSPLKLPPVSTSSLPNVSMKKDKDLVKLPQKLFISPKKEETKMKGRSSSDPLIEIGSEAGFRKFVDGQRQKRSFHRPRKEVTIIENKNYRSEDKNKADENDFLEATTITLDATPPSKKHLPQPVTEKVETSKDDSFDDSLVSLDATLPYVPKSSSSGSGNPNSFVITSKSKKLVWVDPDAEPRSSSSTSQGKKRYKQTSIIACARNMPQKKTDMANLTTYNKGNRLSSQSEGTFTRANKEPSPPTGTKRKSDESIEGDGKRDRSGSESLSQTFFDVSPMKQDLENSHAPLTPPPPIQKKSDATKNKPRSPLSPGKQNIVEEKPVAPRYNLHDSTYNLLKDFDKVPIFKTPPSKAEQSRNHANKVEQTKKQDDPVCCCPPTDSEINDLKDIVDPMEFEKACPVHDGVAFAKFIAEANSPKDYWCTPQYKTQELYEGGRIRVASTPFTPPPRRQRRDSNGDTILFNEENEADL